MSERRHKIVQIATGPGGLDGAATLYALRDDGQIFQAPLSGAREGQTVWYLVTSVPDHDIPMIPNTKRS